MVRYAVTTLSGQNSIDSIFLPNYYPRRAHIDTHTSHVPDMTSWGLAWTKGRTDTIRTLAGSSDTRQMKDVLCGPVVTPSPWYPGTDTDKRGLHTILPHPSSGAVLVSSLISPRRFIPFPSHLSLCPGIEQRV